MTIIFKKVTICFLQPSHSLLCKIKHVCDCVTECGAADLDSLQDSDPLEHLTRCVWGWVTAVAVAFQSGSLGEECRIVTLT